MAVITIVGAGMMGSALAFPARENGHKVRVARAVKLNIKKGLLNEEDFPLLLHIDEILSDKKEVNIPWGKFTFVKGE